ncbi:MAG: ribosome silencing factor [Anaerolineales bacterium]|nr:ribosome silencing factor [Anaerolineales bacterium]
MREVDISEALDIAHTLVEILDEKKGEDILLLELIGVCSFADYFVFCSGTSERMLSALADEAQQAIKKKFELHPRSVEGGPEGGWILIDYNDVILHLFAPDTRSYYQLEDLWRDGNVLLRMH